MTKLFTKKHYEKIAVILEEHKIYNDNLLTKGLVNMFVRMFRKDNPDFDKEKFMKAVGY